MSFKFCGEFNFLYTISLPVDFAPLNSYSVFRIMYSGYFISPLIYLTTSNFRIFSNLQTINKN